MRDDPGRRRDGQGIDAAELLGIDQPKASVLMTYKVKGFSVERVSYRRAYEVTFLIQGWSHSERRRSGSATSRFQAAQQASTRAR